MEVCGICVYIIIYVSSIVDESEVKEKPAQLELQQVVSPVEPEQDSQKNENGDPFNVTTPTDEEARREFVE